MRCSLPLSPLPAPAGYTRRLFVFATAAGTSWLSLSPIHTARMSRLQKWFSLFYGLPLVIRFPEQGKEAAARFIRWTKVHETASILSTSHSFSFPQNSDPSIYCLGKHRTSYMHFIVVLLQTCVRLSIGCTVPLGVYKSVHWDEITFW